MKLGRIGVWTFLDTPPAAALPDLAGELEALGYSAVWVPDTVGRDPFLLAQTLLGATEHLVAATGVANIHARDAVTTSSLANTIAEAHPGRFVLGMGVSHASLVHGRGGVYAQPVAQMRAFLDELDDAFYAGPEPDTAPPRLLAALGPRMLALAAERADGAHPYFVPPEHTAIARGILGEGPILAVEQTVVLSTDPEFARRVARGFVSGYLTMPNYADNLRRLGFDDDDVEQVSDRLVDAVVAWGDSDAICGRVRAHLDAGADHVCVQVLPHDRGTLPLEEWRALAPALLAAAAGT
jgi:probable F420-dependent oxidoreductase